MRYNLCVINLTFILTYKSHKDGIFFRDGMGCIIAIAVGMVTIHAVYVKYVLRVYTKKDVSVLRIFDKTSFYFTFFSFNKPACVLWLQTI